MHQHSLPIKEGIERILHSYRIHCSDKVPFRVTERSSELDALVVFKALLENAVDSSSVARGIWVEVFKPSFENDIGLLNGPPPVLFTRQGNWDAVNGILVKMEANDEEDLTERMKIHTCDWITHFLLPIRTRGRTPDQLLSTDTRHRIVVRFREQILERENYLCPVTLLRDEASPEAEDENIDVVTLDAAHILPFALADTTGRVWDYIRTFTGSMISTIIQDINCVENGILLQRDVHRAFGNLAWGIETRMENGAYRYFIKTFKRVFFIRSGVGNGTELHFVIRSGHPLPSPSLCALHLAVCAMAHACGAADIFKKLFEHDMDIVGPIAGPYTLPSDPTTDNFLIPYLERRLFEESAYVPSV